MNRLMLPVAASALALAGVASADVIFSNFGEGDSYQTNVGYTISDGDPINVDNDQGNDFTVVGGNFVLTSVEVAIGFVTGTNEIELTLHADNSGEPGDVIETFLLDGFGPFGQNNPPKVAVSLDQPLLQENATYWLIASSANNAWLAWNLNDQGDTRNRAIRQNLGPWQINPGADAAAFRINGDVPAPGALALLGVGALLGVRRRRSS